MWNSVEFILMVYISVVDNVLWDCFLRMPFLQQFDIMKNVSKHFRHCISVAPFDFCRRPLWSEYDMVIKFTFDVPFISPLINARHDQAFKFNMAKPCVSINS